MKIILNLACCLLLSFQLVAQIPDLQIQDTLGNFFSLPNYLEDDKNYALMFWSAQDPPSTAALEDYNNYYTNWLNDYDFEFLIVSIDDESLHDGVIDLVNQEGWQYSLFFSPATEVTQTFGINQIPYIYLINKNQEIIFEVAGWLEGNLLDQEISQNFTVGLHAHHPLKEMQIFSTNNNIILEMENVYPFLSISIITIDGKLLLQNTYDGPISNFLSIDARPFSAGTIVIASIASEDGNFISKKLLIQ